MSSRSFLEQSVLNSLPPRVYSSAIMSIMKGNDTLMKDEEFMKHFMSIRIAAGRDMKSRAIVTRVDVIANQFVKYFRKNKIRAGKVMTMMGEWAYALHDAGAIDVSDYGEALNYFDEHYQRIFNEAYEKSNDKQMKKFHKLAEKWVRI